MRLTGVALATALSAVGAQPACTAGEVLGCFADANEARVLNFTAEFGTDPKKGLMTMERCISLCCNAGYGADALVGVEYGAQCFCGQSWAQGQTPEQKDDADCKQYACPADSSEGCGGSNRILVFRPKACPCTGPPAPPPPPASPPLFHGCLDETSKSLPYCDTKLSHEARVEDIIARLSIDERISILSPTVKPYCAVHTPPMDHIGLPKYKWLTETNTDVQGGCTGSRCPTVFIGPTGLGASFNRSSWWAKGDVISTEMRAMNNAGTGEVGLTGYGPNINVVKDPRYGRNSEVPGEDPFLSGSYAVSYLHGMQQMSDAGRPKMLAYVKHYTAYNVESSRFTFTAPVTQFDFWDSYLPQYEMAFTEGNASGAMCSYFGANGVSSCGDPWLLNGLIRDFWKRPDAVVMSDCSAVANMVKNGYAQDKEDASAKALNAGLDIYGGWNDNLWAPPPAGEGQLRKAIDDGGTSAAILNATVRRTLMQKMKVGLFDPLEEQPWTDVTSDVIGSPAHSEVSYEAALQGMVLLKNSKDALPFSKGVSLAVVGPMADEGQGLFSDYAQPHGPYDTIQKALARVNAGGTTTTAKGVAVTGSDSSSINAALSLVKDAAVIVLALGIMKDQEHEAMDRSDTKLPGLQESFAKQVFDAANGKPVVLLLCSGGVLSFDALVQPSSAIVEAFNPAQHGPRALADLLFGDENRWGKLPVTIYEDAEKLDLKDMSFATSPGRSYRYYTGSPLFKFGEGLSYTAFTHTCVESDLAIDFSFRCTVRNTGAREGDEVVMAFHSVSQEIRKAADHPVPFKRLVGFERVRLAPGASTDITITVPKMRLALTNNDGDYALYAGKHQIVFSRGNGDDVELEVAVDKADMRVNSHPPAEQLFASVV